MNCVWEMFACLSVTKPSNCMLKAQKEVETKVNMFQTASLSFHFSDQVNTTGYTAVRAAKVSSKGRCEKTWPTHVATTRTVSSTSARGTAASTAVTRSVWPWAWKEKVQHIPLRIKSHLPIPSNMFSSTYIHTHIHLKQITLFLYIMSFIFLLYLTGKMHINLRFCKYSRVSQKYSFHL